MPIVPKPGESSFAPPPAGTHPAACYRVIDLGTQETNYQGQAKKSHRLMVTWELFSEERMTDGRPFSLSKTYTWSMHEKSTLRKDLESWRGRSFTDADFDAHDGFRIEKLLGVPCLLTVIHETKGDDVRATIKAVSKLPKQMTVGGPENPKTFLWLSADEFSREAFAALSPRLQETIMKSPEYKAVVTGKPVETKPLDPGHDPDDEIPF